MRVRESLGALRERQFRLLFTGRVFSDFGDKVVPVALAFAVLEIDGSPSALGLVFAARVLPMVVFLLVGGVWADRLPRQWVMFGSDGVRALVQAVGAVLLISGAAEVEHLMALMAVYGTAQAFFDPAATGLVPQTISSAKLQQANALLGISRSSFSVLGPVVGGLVTATVGPGWAFAADAVTFAVSAVFLSLLRPVRRARERDREPFARELVAGWREFRSRTWVWASVSHFAFWHLFVLAPFWVLAPVVADRELGGAGAYATIVAAGGLGSVAGGLVALRLEPRRPMLVSFLVLFLFAPQFLALAFAAPTLAIAALALLASGALSYGGTLWYTSLQRHIPEHALSRVSSYDWMGSLLFLPAGYMLAGPAAETIGLDETLYLAAAWAIASSAVLAALPSIRSLPGRERPAAPAPPLSRPREPGKVRVGMRRG